MPFQTDQDWAFLDRVIALALGIVDLANEIKGIGDDPDVLERALISESKALIIQKTSKEYRARLRALKALEENEKPAGANGRLLKEKRKSDANEDR